MSIPVLASWFVLGALLVVAGILVWRLWVTRQAELVAEAKAAAAKRAAVTTPAVAPAPPPTASPAAVTWTSYKDEAFGFTAVFPGGHPEPIDPAASTADPKARELVAAMAKTMKVLGVAFGNRKYSVMAAPLVLSGTPASVYLDRMSGGLKLIHSGYDIEPQAGSAGSGSRRDFLLRKKDATKLLRVVVGPGHVYQLLIEGEPALAFSDPTAKQFFEKFEFASVAAASVASPIAGPTPTPPFATPPFPTPVPVPFGVPPPFGSRPPFAPPMPTPVAKTTPAPAPAPSPAPTAPPAGVPSACKLPSLIASGGQTLFSLGRDPGNEFSVALRSLAAEVPQAAAIFLEAGQQAQSWTIGYVADLNAGQGKLPLASLRREGQDLHFAWDPQRPIEIARQVANCQLEVRLGASAYVVQLREPQVLGEVQLNMRTDKQTVEFSLSDWPKSESLRLEIKELAGFPSGAKIRGDLKSVGLGRAAFIEFPSLPGAEIGLRFYRPSATNSNVVLRLEPEFKENAVVKHELTIEHLAELEIAATKSLANAQAQLPGAERDLASAASALRSLQANKPSNFQEVNIWQQRVTKADSIVKRCNSKVLQLRKQIPEYQARLAAVPKIREFLKDLHEKAAIRYVIAAESGEEDVVLIDGLRPKPAS